MVQKNPLTADRIYTYASKRRDSRDESVVGPTPQSRFIMLETGRVWPTLSSIFTMTTPPQDETGHHNMTEKTLVIASDHGGFDLKKHLAAFIEQQGWTVLDLGTDSTESVDYPDLGQKAARAILDGKAPFSIVICGSGIGISISANRFKGIRCALCTSAEMGRLARLHNDANMLALGGRLTSPEQAEQIVRAFLETGFEGDRHIRRVEKLDSCSAC